MDVRTINSMSRHLADLVVDFLGIQFPVPKPERTNAVSVVRILESRIERLRPAGWRRPVREIGQTTEVDPTNARAS